ncbi:MAG: sigma 54-interacting transcriptional regulator [Bacteroidota bacterium]
MKSPLNIDDKAYPELDELIPSFEYTFHNSHLKDFRVSSSRMKTILDDLKKLASTTGVPLLITGSTGSGKELAAKFLHYEVDQSPGAYIAINCTNMNKEMFEAELFGYKGGAFTGASREGHRGYIKQAEGGTLFLDEVSEIDLDLQAKLLRMLEEREYYPVGGSRKQQVNCRMVFATNRNLEKMVEEGLIRQDLYYRLNVVKIRIPSLEERKEEILPLMAYFVKNLNRDFKKDVRYIQGKVLKFMYSYNWPGNIRELKNFITQIMVFIEGDTINFEHLQTRDELDRMQTRTFSGKLSSGALSKQEIIEELLKEPFDLEGFTLDVVQAALRKFNGNKSKTAQFLGLKREQLYNRYKTD